MMKIAKTLTSNTDFLTAQPFIFERKGEEETLFILLSGVGEDVFSKIRHARGIAEQEFLTSPLPPSNKLTKILYLFSKGLTDIDNLQILLALVHKNTLYIKSYGYHEAHLLRNKMVLTLTSDTSGEKLISGYLQKGDRLLLITSPHIETLHPQHLVTREEILVDSILKRPLTDLKVIVNDYVQRNKVPEPLAVVLVDNFAQIDDQLLEEKPLTGEEEWEIPAIVENVYPPGKGWFSIKHIFSRCVSLVKKILGLDRRIQIGMVLGLIIVAATLVNLYTYKKEQDFKKAQYLTLYNQAQGYYERALQLKDTDTQQTGQAIILAKEALAQAAGINPEDARGRELERKITENTDEFLKIYAITDWPVYLSLDLIKEGFSSTYVSYSLGNLLLLDEKQKTLVAIDIETKKPILLGGKPTLGEAVGASINGRKIFSYSPEKGVMAMDINGAKPVPAIKPDPAWGSIADIYAFGGNVYLLDRAKNQVWKYIYNGTTFLPKAEYFVENQNLQLSSAVRMQIDSSVWVLTTEPNILRFTSGVSDFFSLSGLDEPIETISAFYVSDITNSVYIVDPDNSRLVVVGKDGKYQAQYTGEKFKVATDVVVLEEEKKILILAEGKIYRVGLR